MALAQKTDMLFLDEPTTFLDIAHQLDIMQLLVQLNREQGVTIVMVIHDLNHAAMFSDYVVAVRNGIKKVLRGWKNMIFEQLLFQAKEGDLESITDILNMYRPLLLKYSVIDGRLDEDLYQEQCITLMRAIKLFRI